MLDNYAKRLRAAAIEYARLGFDVFPLIPGEKIPYKGSHGELDATDEPDIAGRLWTDLPGSNIGWFVGPCTWAFVLDVDERNGGAEWLAARGGHDAIGKTVKVRTPSRGFGGHWWMLMLGELQNVKCKGLSDKWTNGHGDVLFEDKVDIKGLQGGYVLLPPSNVKGLPYVFEDGSEYGDTEPGHPPDWLETEILDASSPCKARNDHMGPVDARSFSHGRFFIEHALLGEQIRAGVWHAACPNRAQHTGKPRKFAGDVVLFAPPPGVPGTGYAYCAHAHCRDLNQWILNAGR